jgi:ribose-phosphate pyrophosphokinase
MRRPLSGEGLLTTGFGDLKVFSGSAHPQLTREIADCLGIPLGQARLRRFPDSEVSFQIDENIRGADVFIVQPTSNPVDQHLMELLVMIDAFRRSSAARITAVIPYYGYARQDRKDKPRVPISAKLVANLLSAAGTNRVLTMDLHKAQIQGFFDIPVDHLFAAPVIIEYCARLQMSNLTIVSPDAGGAERARAYAKRLDAELAVVDKRRTEDGTAEVMNVIGDVQGRTCILQDDIIDTAGTICKAAVALEGSRRRAGARVRVHGVLSGPAIERIEKSPLDQLIVTNSMPLAARRRLQEDRRADGRAAARAGDTEYSRRDLGLVVVRVDWNDRRPETEDRRPGRRERYGSDTRSSDERGPRQERGEPSARLGRIPSVVYGTARRARRRKAWRLPSIPRRCCESCTRTRARTR